MGRTIHMLLILNYVRAVLTVDPAFYILLLFVVVRAYLAFPKDEAPSEEEMAEEEAYLLAVNVPCNCLSHRLFGHRIAA